MSMLLRLLYEIYPSMLERLPHASSYKQAREHPKIKKKPIAALNYANSKGQRQVDWGAQY